MNLLWFVLLPMFTAFVAWLTAYGVVYFAFYSVGSGRIGSANRGGYVFAFLRDNSGDLSAQLAEELEAISKKEVVITASSTAAITPLIEAHLDTYLRVRLKEKMPVIASFIGESTIVKLKESMIEEVTLLLPEVMNGYLKNHVNASAIQPKIRSIIEGITIDKVADNVGQYVNIALKKLPKYFALVGFILGLLFGLIASLTF